MDLAISVYGGKTGVAVSGGIDSMCLLHAFISTKQDILVINVEHGIRGETSVRDTDFVRNFCKLHGVPFVTRSVDATNNMLVGESIETCARRLRYEFFDELLASKTVDRIALAHHADDNAETVLMRIFRGTGLRGLKGISDRDNFVRPFIFFTRKQIEEYALSHSIPYVNDETNYSSDYTRNYIRNEIMPLIKARYHDVSAMIARLSLIAQETDEYLSSVAPRGEKVGNEYHIKSLFGYPSVIQKYAIMNTIREMGFLQDFENRHVESVCSLSKKPNNTVISLPFNLICVKYGDGVIITEKKGDEFLPVPFSVDGVYAFAGNRYFIKEGKEIVKNVSVDGDRLPDGCEVRTRKDGDVFKRVNGKRKLLSDFLNEKKLSLTEKNSLLVLAHGSDVFAVFGIDTSDDVKITDNTKKILHILRERT